VDDFFVFSTGRRGKAGRLEIGDMFHDEAPSAYKFMSVDQHLSGLVARLITEASERCVPPLLNSHPVARGSCGGPLIRFL
jgi:hypothetical protein